MEKKFITKKAVVGNEIRFYNLYEIYSVGQTIEEFVRDVITSEDINSNGYFHIKAIPLILGCEVPDRIIPFSKCETENEVQSIFTAFPDYVRRGYIDTCTMEDYGNEVAIRMSPIIGMKDLQRLCNKIKVHYRYEE